jgi:hypothetical protein
MKVEGMFMMLILLPFPRWLKINIQFPQLIYHASILEPWDWEGACATRLGCVEKNI